MGWSAGETENNAGAAENNAGGLGNCAGATVGEIAGAVVDDRGVQTGMRREMECGWTNELFLSARNNWLEEFPAVGTNNRGIYSIIYRGAAWKV